MAVKVVLMYNLTTGGAKRPGSTEPWYYLADPPNLLDPAFHTACETLMNARTALMGANVTAIGYRCSFPGVPRKSVRRLANTVSGANINPAPVVSQGPSDIANSAVQCEGFGPDLQRSNKYLAGLPDAFITTLAPGGPQFSAVGLTGYQNLWNAWVAIVLNGSWGFRCRADLPVGQPFSITSWQQSPDPPFELVMGVATVNGIWGVGDILQVRGVLMQEDWQPRPIGKWRVRTVTQVGLETQYLLRASSGYDASTIEQPGTVESVAFSYVSFTSMDPANQTSRKRGVGPVRPVGRRKPPTRRQPA
jgi:hypothetical protein